MIGNPSTEHKSMARGPSATWNLLIAALLLLPSAWFLSQFSDLPRFGQLHDDSLYFVSAKSLAEGHGYRIESLPGEPAQTKYPPLYPLLLSIAWRVVPTFPQNLALAGWLSWLALPAILAQLGWIFSGLGFDRMRTWGLLALFGLNPYVMLFSTQLLSELWFLAFVLAAMLLLERGLALGSARLVVAAGAVAGLAYLTRSAGLALFAAGAVYLGMIHKERRLAGLFAVTAAPFALGWTAWARGHQAVTNDPELIYYLDYFRYEFYAISWSDLPVVLWKNTDGLLAGLGGMMLPKINGSLFEKILGQVIAVAMISGVVRLIRRGSGWLFGLFAAFSALLLLVWHFPPNERFVLPLFPLALAGLWVEAEHFVGLLRVSLQHKDSGQRVVAAGMMGFAGLFAIAVLAVQAYVGGIYLPDDARHHRADKLERQAAYQWVVENTPASATVLSADDGMLYLHTGRHAMRRPVPPFLWYREDHAGTIAWLGEPAAYAREHRLDFFDFAGVDVSLGVGDDDSATIVKKIHTSTELQQVMQQGEVTLYRVRPRDSDAAALRTPPPPPIQ
jgi:hypothetical protein